VRWFIGGYGLSAVGTGLCYPFLAIYLREVLGMSVSAVALLLLVLAGVAVPLSMAAGRLCDRRRALRGMSICALVVQAAGWFVSAAAWGSGIELLAVLLIGMGTGLFLPVVVPILHRLTATEQARARAFALPPSSPERWTG
jgi:predicted MFS family arabinose efflux permease